MKLAKLLPVGVLALAASYSNAQGRISENDPNVFIPETSIEHPGDAGFRMHTNHLIYVGAPRVAPGPSWAASIYPLSPQQLRTAYGLPSSGGSGTIVIVDAFDYPTALADFNFFSATYGLPQETSTNVLSSSNNVFQVVYATGNKPHYNAGWSQEAALDVEWAHAMAPGAKIVLVEAASNSGSNLYSADDVAATITGVKECSNSWSGSEFKGESASDTHFQHAGVVYFFSSGDTGGKPQYPTASPYVVGVGGTTLNVDESGNRLSESGWSGSGGGLSRFEPRPGFQDVISGTVGTNRGIPDISADADPNTGVAVYWNGTWYQFGGTSVSCPCIAGMVNNASSDYSSGPLQNSAIYGGLGAEFFDITTGRAARFRCVAGWDFVTGVGSPNGLGGL